MKQLIQVLQRVGKPTRIFRSPDGRKADCVWATQSLDRLKNFLDREIGTAARNDYFQINSGAAFGLPGQEEMRKAA